MKKSTRNIVYAVVLVVILGFFSFFMVKNHRYNTTLRTRQLNQETYNGTEYDLGDISVDITVRSGDSGAWLKDPILDDDGNELHGASVGTIYEAVITNHSKNVVSDWKLTIPINEMMWINNNWNSKMEIHQNVAEDEKVLLIDLSDYSEYDINLDYYIDHTGPMIPLYVGDYFTYYPEEIAEEKPIAPSKTGAVGEATARFGYIMYIPDQTVDYVADFSGGEIEYYMYENPRKQGWFWTAAVLLLIWMISAIITLIVEHKMKNLLKIQQIQKMHDEEMVRQTMQLIINMIESKDINTKGHSIRVAEISQKLASRMGFSEEDAKLVYYIGLLHDCGKVNISDSILKNPGRLSNEEYEIMKKHTVYGADILKDFTSIEDIDIGAKYHHERYDGKGYPSGLAGEDIPMIARIIGVADAFDAMNSKRCYRDKLQKEVIIKELRDNRGKQFDPEIVDIMLTLIEEGCFEML